MDELLHHCLRELSFDGDLGCNVSRLRDFIVDFYAHSGTPQNTDDAFCAFVWSLVAQQPTVRIGTVPPGVASEVWIAPQISAKRKAKAKGEEHVETTPTQLDIVPGARERSLDDLQKEYGDKLRIAVDPDAIYAAVTGSHIRFAKLSPMVYSALQIVTRGRDNGVTVVELGQKSKYDQKTCFYLVRQLTELDLVVKVRRGGVGTHFVIHRHFFDRSPHWKAIREEENQAESSHSKVAPDSTTDIYEEEERNTDPQTLDFTPIDARHLSSLPLIRGRVVKLLKASKNQMHASNNMLITLGFANPTKTDRRFFQSRIREMIQQGVIEKVVVPISKDRSGRDDEVVVVQPQDGDDDEKEVGEQSGVKMNITIHKQIFDLLEGSGMVGMTLNELSVALCQFDKRTIELLLTRAEKFPPPPHLSDLGIAGLMETSGRERRHRYFTVASYRQLLAKEKLDNNSAGYSDVDFSNVGEFLPVNANLFYKDQNALHQYQDSFKDTEKPSGKKRTLKNPILADGTVKQGRPRKYPVGEDPKSLRKQAQKRKLEEAVPAEKEENGQPGPNKKRRLTTTEGADSLHENTKVPKKRGRPPKGKQKESDRPQEEIPPATKKRSKLSKAASHTDEAALPASQRTSARRNGTVTIDQVTSSSRKRARIKPDAKGSEAPIETISGDEAESGASKRTRFASEPSATLRADVPKLSPSIDKIYAEEESINQGSQKGTRVNVSHLRRENELYRVVENMGGIVNIQTKDFFEEHIALLEAMTKAGEPTSAPAGTRTDKRTAVSTFNNLEKRGRIKQLKTSVMTHTGIRRPVCIVYLPSISQEKLNAFLADLSRGIQSTPHPGNFVKIDEHVEYGADPASIPRGALPLQLLQMEQPGDDRKERWSKNISRAKQLFSYNDSVIQDVLLTERTTLAQLYGFIVGKAVRCREFHLSTLGAFENRNPSSNIISHEKRIVDLSFFCHDISLGLYCSLVSSLSHSDDLTRFIATPEGCQTLVRDLPPTINTTLQIGRSRARSRFLDILETLRALKLVTPLQSSKSDTPWITCEVNEGRPNAFDIASLDGWTVSTPMAAPTYWHFNDIAPIHVWATSEMSPPFWQDVAVGSTTNAMNFWRLLQEASTRTDIVTANMTSATGPMSVPVSVARSLRRQVSWNSEYILTWHQSQYLRQFADAATGKTPLEGEDEGTTQIEKISWVISAPQQSVRSFFHTTHLKLLRDIEKLRKKATRAAGEKKAKRATATKASLAKKAADARQLREEEWDNMIRRLYPMPLEPAADVRLRRIRVRFLQAGSIKDLGKWEDEINDAIVPVPVDPAPLTVAVNPPEKPVETLIAMQGPPLVPCQDKAKRKRKGKSTEDEAVKPKPKTLRRHRFQWNRDYEELARDASAIIRARCRNLPRLDWAAFEQVFPAVPRNTVRQRLAHIRETPGNEAYLNRLEDRWYEIWVQHRGTPLLPDDDPMSASNFNLIKHVEFLRQHVDKNALRVGFAQPKESAGTTLSASVDMLLAEYDVVESTSNVPSWDFVWNAVVEEGREKQMLRQPFLKTPEDMPPVGETSLEAVALAEAALKVTLGTPYERYHAELASTLLHTIGENYVSVATKNLLSRGVLSKLVRDPQKQMPGRQLKISEGNQNAVGGSIPRETFQDATALEELSLQDGGTWREWPLIASDGDSAALIQLASENKVGLIHLYAISLVMKSLKVDFKVDTSHAQSCRPALDWNSKKADDDQIETAVHIRTIVTSLSQPQITTPDSSPAQTTLSLPTEYDPAHGQSVDGGIASCKRMTNIGLADCMVCLEEEWTSFNDGLSPEERELAIHILTIVRHGAEHGVTKSHLRVSFVILQQNNLIRFLFFETNTNVAVTSEQLFSIIKKMTESPVPMLFWAGYSSLVLVSSAYVKDWTILVSEDPATRIFPRRWLDISGHKIVDFWEAALKAVMGIIVFRPGITQAELRWRLRSVYDRQEVGDLVRFLVEDGFLKMRTDPAIVWNNLNVAALDDREDKGVFWFVLYFLFLFCLLFPGWSIHDFVVGVQRLLWRPSGFPVFTSVSSSQVVSMRVKQLWNSTTASSGLVWDRITFSKLTIAYSAFSLIHFVIQLSFQIKAFAINADASSFLYGIVVKGNAVNDSLPILHGNTLFMCSWVQSDLNLDGEQCFVVWNGTKGINSINAEVEGSSSSTISGSIPILTATPISTSLSSNLTLALRSKTVASATIGSDSVGSSTVTVLVRPADTSPSVILDDYAKDEDDFHEHRELSTRSMPRILAFEENGKTSVNISGMGFRDTTLNPTCVWALNWPVSVLHNTIREDIVFIAFQFWVLGMSVVALLNESIPHILASLLTHMMATAWAAFEIKHTADFKSYFTRVITNGACSRVSMSLLPSYWRDRGIAEFTSLAFNVLALLISSFLTWNLFKSFGWQTFKRVGASLTINRVYKIVLTLYITIQLSMFFMAVTVSLWLDQLFNSPIGDLVDFETLYKVTSFITLVLLVPWLMTGWVAVRRELRVPMFIFLMLSILYLGGWSVMFFSTTFRWAFVTWRFFSIMATASVFLTVVSLVLGVVCRYNFGKGLLRYLDVQQNLSDDDLRFHGRSDEGKVDFPSNEKLVPTFAATFGRSQELSKAPRNFPSNAATECVYDSTKSIQWFITFWWR
ncbi:Transcription factor tau subunit sfc3 [Termitomyces sp. J132]|nr:Transcription factor tau subunit sfc3 [Termitomyces sp. J132]